jgi:hypothetical protein
MWPGKKIINGKINSLGKTASQFVGLGKIEKADVNHPPLIVFDCENKPGQSLIPLECLQ